jgi:hypothetical protein
MINTLENILACEICEGPIHLNSHLTINAYSRTIDLSIRSSITKNIDDIINQYLVYKCKVCGQEYRYTYKEIEKLARKKLTERLLLKSAREGMHKSPLITEKYYIYCGKCSGYDGKGSCPLKIFNDCKIKEFPLDDI